jgi:hypothetical protein
MRLKPLPLAILTSSMGSARLTSEFDFEAGGHAIERLAIDAEDFRGAPWAILMARHKEAQKAQIDRNKCTRSSVAFWDQMAKEPHPAAKPGRAERHDLQHRK